MTLEQAYETIEHYYNRMLIIGTTSGRKYQYERICGVMIDCPEVRQYWEIKYGEFYYKDRVVKIQEYTKPTVTVIDSNITLPDIFWDIECGGTICCSYILYLKDLDMIKVGKAKDFKKRYKQLSREYGEVIPLHWFEFDNEEDAYIMEVILHKYYKEKYPNSNFIPQDRFGEAGLTVADLETLTQVAERIRTENWF